MTSTDQKASREKAVAFIVARLSSSRLPAKHLRKIGDKMLIEWTLDGLSKSEELDEIVIATVAEEENEPLRDFAREQGIPCFWYEGEVDHVTTRLRRAAEEFEADLCVLVSGDCPLIHAPLIDTALRELRKPPKVDIVRVQHELDGKKISQQGLSFSRRETWQKADDLSDRPELKEHHFPIIGRRPELFSSRHIRASRKLYSPLQRASVDTYADLRFMREVHDTLKNRGEEYTLSTAIALVRERPELLELNSHVHQRRLVEDIKKVLYIPQSSDLKIDQSLDWCSEIVEHLSWPVTFVSDSEHFHTQIQERGFKLLDISRGDKSDHIELERISSFINNYDIVLFEYHEQNTDFVSILANIESTSALFFILDKNKEPPSMTPTLSSNKSSLFSSLSFNAFPLNKPQRR